MTRSKACSTKRRRYAGGSASATACSNSAQATSASSPPRPTTSRCGRPAATSGSKSVPAPPAPTSRRAVPPSATAPRTRKAALRPHPQRFRTRAPSRHHRHLENYQQADGSVVVPKSWPIHRLRHHRRQIAIIASFPARCTPRADGRTRHSRRGPSFAITSFLYRTHENQNPSQPGRAATA